MKQHKDKAVWAHRPDALPLPDAPSTGARRKKGVKARESEPKAHGFMQEIVYEEGD